MVVLARVVCSGDGRDLVCRSHINTAHTRTTVTVDHSRPQCWAPGRGVSAESIYDFALAQNIADVNIECACDLQNIRRNVPVINLNN